MEQKDIKTTLLELGIPPRPNGFNYLCMAITLWKPGICVGELTNLIKDKMNLRIKTRTVDRGIRYVLENMKIPENHSWFYEIQGLKDGKDYPLAPLKFISFIYQKLYPNIVSPQTIIESMNGPQLMLMNTLIQDAYNRGLNDSKK